MSIIEALNKLPENIREAAIKNHEEYKNKNTGIEFHDNYNEIPIHWALENAFIWEDTEEGLKFWASKRDELKTEKK